MSDLALAIADLKEDEVKKIVQAKISSGVDPMSIVDECRQGMEIVGERYKIRNTSLVNSLCPARSSKRPWP